MTDRRRGESCTAKDSDRQLAERGAYTENDRQTRGMGMHGERQTNWRGVPRKRQTEGRGVPPKDGHM